MLAVCATHLCYLISNLTMWESKGLRLLRGLQKQTGNELSLPLIKSSWTCSLGPGSAGPNLNFPVHVTPRADGRRFFCAGLWPTPIKSCQSLMETPRVTHLADVEGKPSRGFPPSPADWLAELWREAGKMLPHAVPVHFSVE